MMTRFGIRLVTVLLAISMVPHPRCEHATADQQASGSKLHQKYSKEGRRTVVNMPFASIFGSELIGSTGGQRTDRHWLVQRIPSGELTMMHRAYPRFPIPEGWKNIMVPWKDTITYEVNSQTARYLSIRGTGAFRSGEYGTAGWHSFGARDLVARLHFLYIRASLSSRSTATQSTCVWRGANGQR
jgi:hypothetical protein